MFGLTHREKKTNFISVNIDWNKVKWMNDTHFYGVSFWSAHGIVAKFCTFYKIKNLIVNKYIVDECTIQKISSQVKI